MLNQKPSLTGRMDHSGPDLQNMPLPSSWQGASTRLKMLANRALGTGLPVLDVQQVTIRTGDLVAWKALTKEGLWRVVEGPRMSVLTEIDYSAIEIRLAEEMYKFEREHPGFEMKTQNPCNEVALGRSRLRSYDEVVLEWVGGPCGPVSNLTGPVNAPLKDVRSVTEMEAIAIAASE